MTQTAITNINAECSLSLNYSGRIIDHLGIQMYQSPVAAIAELVANAWDADADNVKIELPNTTNKHAEIVVADDGIGMTFDECDKRFLIVGYARRGSSNVERSITKERKILGRKGIGKFAGFGIAQVIHIETVSQTNGERTVFEMDIEKLRADSYVNPEGTNIEVLEYEEPDEDRKQRHGTIIRLRNLSLSRRRNPENFAHSMARRFLLHQTAAGFNVSVNGSPLPESNELLPEQFSFPTDYTQDECPDGLQLDGDWGKEKVGEHDVRWRFRFYEEPIADEELRGISVFAGGKMVQAPFFFNITRGLTGQHGQQYISGQIQADYLDEQEEDLTAPERQRINWEHSAATPLLEWGENRLRDLLKIWVRRRGEKRERQLQERIGVFGERLNKLSKSEQKTVSQAIRRIGQIETLTQTQFEDLGEAIIVAWEQGRLKDLITEISGVEILAPDRLVEILVEADVLMALNIAEAVKTKLSIVNELKQRIKDKELENAVRDYISNHPWIISPQWETFAKERNVHGLNRAANEADINTHEGFRGRVDLALASGDHLLILEFMRPGLTLDWDHVERFERYVRIVREGLQVNTGGRFSRVTGYVVADKINRQSGMAGRIQALRREDMFALDWETLFSNATAQWDEFIDILAAIDPHDERLQSLRTTHSES